MTVLAALVFIEPAPAAAQPDVDAIIAHAKAGAGNGSPGEIATLDSLMGALRESHDPIPQIKLVDAIGLLGRSDGTSAPEVKAKLHDEGPLLLLGVISSDADWSVRAEALVRLRDLNPPDAVLKKAIAVARADKGEHAGFLAIRAAMLENWRLTRPAQPDQAPLSPIEIQQRAVALLKRRGIEANYDSLASAIAVGKPDLVSELLTAGVKIGRENAKRATDAVINGMTSACEEHSVPPDKVAQALSVLVADGFPLDYTDEAGNTILMSAAQYCSAPISDRLIELGAAVDVVNKQQFRPLQMALVTGKWDVARVLVDHGAHLTRQQVEQLFFEAPQEPDQRKLLQRATR
jgi:hypothetical protein